MLNRFIEIIIEKLESFKTFLEVNLGLIKSFIFYFLLVSIILYALGFNIVSLDNFLTLSLRKSENFLLLSLEGGFLYVG